MVLAVSPSTAEAAWVMARAKNKLPNRRQMPGLCIPHFQRPTEQSKSHRRPTPKSCDKLQINPARPLCFLIEPKYLSPVGPSNPPPAELSSAAKFQLGRPLLAPHQVQNLKTENLGGTRSITPPALNVMSLNLSIQAPSSRAPYLCSSLRSPSRLTYLLTSICYLL